MYDIETPQIMKFSTELFIDVSAHHKMNLALTEKGAIHWWGKFPNEPPREDGRKEGKNQNFIPMKLTSGSNFVMRIKFMSFCFSQTRSIFQMS